MSGGINGALLHAGGTEMQKELHGYLYKQGKKYVEPGFVKRIGPAPFHFKSIIYTVAIDGFYQSSIELVEKSLANALSLLAEDKCNTIAVSALATGYGNLSKKDFGKALKLCLENGDWQFLEMCVVLKNNIDKEEVEQGYYSLA